MEPTIYVLGHRNPDTDSIVAAFAYAHFKRETGTPNCVAARAGMLNPQTEYIFERFKVQPPQFLPDLVPKVDYFLSGPADTIEESVPLWDALDKMEVCESKTLAIVDAQGHYVSMLHYGIFAKNMLKKINPHKKNAILTSVGHIARTMQGQPITLFNEDERFRARVLVAALDLETFVKHIKSEPASNTVVVVGDRRDVQARCIEAGVRMLIISNGMLPCREIKEAAEQAGVSILSSPYDTSSTAMLVSYSTPVGTMGDASIKPVRETDQVKRVRRDLMQSPSRSLPVVDEEGRVLGLLGEGDLIRDPKVELILVDHNELSQAIEGAENYRIREVLDHHKLGSFSTRYPINFINRTVGSTSSIIAGMYREGRVPLTRQIASILLCGILSDTLLLQSATTTEEDREIAEYLANVADLDIDAIGHDIMSTASDAAKKPAGEIVSMDLKEYAHAGKRFTVSQIEVTATGALLDRKDELLKALGDIRTRGGYAFSALMVTDVVELSSFLMHEGDKDIAAQVEFPRFAPGCFELKNILSRKKQLVPILLDAIEGAVG